MDKLKKKGRRKMSCEKYIAQHHMSIYFQDAISQLLECKAENIKLETTNFFYEYFTSVYDGTNIIYRDFIYVFATPRNRTSFIKIFWSTFKHLGTRGDLLGINDYYSLMQLICRDFDFNIVQKTVNIVLMDDAIDCVIALSDFIYMFELLFYYSEFCDFSVELFHKIQATNLAELSVDENAWEENKNHCKSYYVSAELLGSSFKDELYIKTPDYCVPCEEVLFEVLENTSKVTFFSFMSALAKNEHVITSIGVLPVLPVPNVPVVNVD